MIYFNPDDFPNLFVAFVVMLIIVLFVVGVLCSIKENKEPSSPPLRRYNYEPVYVQLNNEQFERLIDALKKTEVNK